MVSQQQKTGVPEAIEPPSLDRSYIAYLTCSSTNHFLSLSEHFSAWLGAPGGWAEGCGKVQWAEPPQLPFCAAENFESRRKFSFLAVTA